MIDVGFGGYAVELEVEKTRLVDVSFLKVVVMKLIEVDCVESLTALLSGGWFSQAEKLLVWH